MTLINPIAPYKSSNLLLSNYNYLRFLTRSRVAWEYLRRNSDYRLDWYGSRAGRNKPVRLIDGTQLLRIRRSFVRAEAWGLHMFRQSQSISA